MDQVQIQMIQEKKPDMFWELLNTSKDLVYKGHFVSAEKKKK